MVVHETVVHETVVHETAPAPDPMTVPLPNTVQGRVARWRVVGTSVRGASHRRHGLPNQDALRWWPESGLGPPLVLAVADGHGSAKCFRSDVGSRLAVAAAVEVGAALLAPAGATAAVPDPL
ncbi:MAG: protein phosphatase 2C domain-containing protein, partial [Chloroflexota bacterium]|nr:protein phosphatase 2C domain-containing protein [Chloroflexota bacterium]